MDKVIARIPKNSMEEVRVSLTTYRRHDLLDTRIYFKDEDGEWRPSRKGLTLKVDYLPDLLKALCQAKKEARKAGTLKE